MSDRKAYMRELMRKKRANKSANTKTEITDAVSTQSVSKLNPVSKAVSIWHPEISQDRFKGVGRGIPVDGYVLVSIKSEPNGNTEHGIVDVDTWRARLNKVCAHGLAGWSCKSCLPA